MRWITRLLVLAIIGYLALPYYSLYRLDHALVANDTVQLNRYIDLDQVRSGLKRGLRVEGGGQQEGMASRIFRETANSMSAFTVDRVVTMDWVRQQLSGTGGERGAVSLYESLDHAFFESPNRFLVRLGELGENPLHFMMRREGLVWRVTELY